MARRVTVLERTDDGTGALELRVVLWAVRPVARQAIALATDPGLATFVSAIPVTGAAVPNGVTPAEVADLRAGKIVERVVRPRWPTGSTLATVKDDLIDAAAAFQDEIDADNPWRHYGTTISDTGTVTNGGVS